MYFSNEFDKVARQCKNYLLSFSLEHRTS